MQTSRWLFSGALAVLILAAALRSRGVQRWALNNDEIVQVQWSSQSFSGMMTDVRRDAVHPPLDYFIQFLVGRLGGPEWSRRIPNVVFGIATVGLVILLGRWWFSPAAGLAAGILMALAPMHIRYSQEVRPYSSARFFILASLAALEYYARTQRRRWFFAWAVLVFMAGATLYFAGMVVGVVSIFRVLAGRRNELRVAWRWLPAVIVAWLRDTDAECVLPRRAARLARHRHLRSPASQAGGNDHRHEPLGGSQLRLLLATTPATRGRHGRAVLHVAP